MSNNNSSIHNFIHSNKKIITIPENFFKKKKTNNLDLYFPSKLIETETDNIFNEITNNDKNSSSEDSDEDNFDLQELPKISNTNRQTNIPISIFSDKNNKNTTSISNPSSFRKNVEKSVEIKEDNKVSFRADISNDKNTEKNEDSKDKNIIHKKKIHFSTIDTKKFQRRTFKLDTSKVSTINTTSVTENNNLNILSNNDRLMLPRITFSKHKALQRHATLDPRLLTPLIQLSSLTQSKTDRNGSIYNKEKQKIQKILEKEDINEEIRDHKEIYDILKNITYSAVFAFMGYNQSEKKLDIIKEMEDREKKIANTNRLSINELLGPTAKSKVQLSQSKEEIKKARATYKANQLYKRASALNMELLCNKLNDKETNELKDIFLRKTPKEIKMKKKKEFYNKWYISKRFWGKEKEPEQSIFNPPLLFDQNYYYENIKGESNFSSKTNRSPEKNENAEKYTEKKDLLKDAISNSPYVDYYIK